MYREQKGGLGINVCSARDCSFSWNVEQQCSRAWMGLHVQDFYCLNNDLESYCHRITQAGTTPWRSVVQSPN